MAVTNRRLAPFDGKDFYVTPSWGTESLLQFEKFVGPIMEPCCGDGAISKVLLKAGYDVVSSDLHKHGYGEQIDFFSIKRRYSNVVTNPPYDVAEEILLHALKIARRKVCLLLRTAFLESKHRWVNIYSKTPPSRVLVFSSRISMYKASVKRTDGGTTSYSWFVWDKADLSKETKLLWISPRT